MNARFGMATEFEYRHRFLILALIYLSTYAFYNVDHTNVVWALGHWDPAHPIALDRQVFSFAALVAGMGVALWTWARAYSPIENGAGSQDSPEVLITDGPYRYVRNPVYLGSLLLAIGFGFFQSRLGFPLLIALHVIFLYRLIDFEEAKLRERYGDAFLAYCRDVPRLLPALRPLASAGTREPRWRHAITREAYLWGYVVTLIAFVVTLDDRVGYRFTEAAICVWLLQKVCRALFSKRRPPDN
jgi:protein-S-isoprenylcysteine O-methyltransferase Ste14